MFQGHYYSKSNPSKVSEKEQVQSQRQIKNLVERRRRKIDTAITTSAKDPMYKYYGRSKPIPIKLSEKELKKREKKEAQKSEERLREIDGLIATAVLEQCITSHFGRLKPLKRRHSR